MAYRTQLPPVFGLRREIDRLFEDTFGNADARRAFGPSVDVHEDERFLTFEFELPGVNPDQVDVSFENGLLTVRGEKRAEREQKEGTRFHHTERSYGTFTRSFQLPQSVDESGIEANFEHGVLMVRVPKAQRPQPKKIEIKRGAGSQQSVQGGAPGGQQRVSSSHQDVPSRESAGEGNGAASEARARQRESAKTNA